MVHLFCNSTDIPLSMCFCCSLQKATFDRPLCYIPKFTQQWRTTKITFPSTYECHRCGQGLWQCSVDQLCPCCSFSSLSNWTSKCIHEVSPWNPIQTLSACKNGHIDSRSFAKIVRFQFYIHNTMFCSLVVLYSSAVHYVSFCTMPSITGVYVFAMDSLLEWRM